VVITVVGNYFFIPMAGYTGSSWAALLCYAFMAVSCYLIGQKYFPVPYQITSGLAYLLGTTMLVYAIQPITFHNQWLDSAFHVVVILCYVAVIYLAERKAWMKPTAD
jgi:O-antigen/teichoic acid export membrane protein